MGALSWLFGNDEPVVHKAPPLQQYPTADDAAFARKNGAFYGTAMDPFANGDLATLLAQKGGAPISAVGQSLPAVTNPANGQLFSGPDVNYVTADTYARAGLAANRSALATLGLDPRRFTLDGVTPENSTNVAGAYSPETDHGFAVAGRGADGASTLTHESIHRGLQKLRESGRAPAYSDQRDQPKTPEEDLVRIIMQKQMGDPEQSAFALKKKRGAYDNFLARDGAMQKYVDNYILRLEEAAAQELARDKPRGPR